MLHLLSIAQQNKFSMQECVSTDLYRKKYYTKTGNLRERSISSAFDLN